MTTVQQFIAEVTPLRDGRDDVKWKSIINFYWELAYTAGDKALQKAADAEFEDWLRWQPVTRHADIYPA